MLRVKTKFGVLITTFLLILSGCSSDDKKSDTPEGAFAIAQDYEKNERYEEAIKRYQEVKNKFPYSKYATMAELAIGDVYYKQESFPEAQVAYQSFKDLHPKHQQIDYVTFRVGLSFYMQLPSSTDRDLTLANNAISFFEEIEKFFPSSQFVKEAQEKKIAAIKMLAEKEDYIASFYFIREKYDSALVRYEGLLKKYPGQGFDEKALSRIAISYAKVGDIDKARKYLKELQQKFPEASETRAAEQEVR